MTATVLMMYRHSNLRSLPPYKLKRSPHGMSSYIYNLEVYKHEQSRCDHGRINQAASVPIACCTGSRLLRCCSRRHSNLRSRYRVDVCIVSAGQARQRSNGLANRQLTAAGRAPDQRVVGHLLAAGGITEQIVPTGKLVKLVQPRFDRIVCHITAEQQLQAACRCCGRAARSARRVPHLTPPRLAANSAAWVGLERIVSNLWTPLR